MTLPPPGPLAAAPAPSHVRVLAQGGAAQAGTAPVRLLALDDGGKAFSLRVRLARRSHGLAPDMARGYQLFCGGWTRTPDGGVRLAEALLESYRFPARTEDRRPRILSLSPAGPEAFSGGGMRYAPLPRLAFDAAAQQRIRFTCAQTSGARAGARP